MSGSFPFLGGPFEFELITLAMVGAVAALAMVAIVSKL